jgi:hypothetical protein
MNMDMYLDLILVCIWKTGKGVRGKTITERTASVNKGNIGLTFASELVVGCWLLVVGTHSCLLPSGLSSSSFQSPGDKMERNYWLIIVGCQLLVNFGLHTSSFFETLKRCHFAALKLKNFTIPVTNTRVFSSNTKPTIYNHEK